MKVDAVMIFAAGFGTRMGALTQDLPKPMLKVAGRPLIDHALDLANDACITTKVINTHYLAPILTAHLTHTDVIFSHEAARPLETGGGLRKALPHLGAGPVFTLNPDVIWTGHNPLSQLAAAWDPAVMDALLMVMPAAKITHPNRASDFALSKDNRLSRDLSGGKDTCFYASAQIIKTESLADVNHEVFSLNLIWDQMIAKNTLFACVHPGGWADVGSPQGLLQAEALLKADANV